MNPIKQAVQKIAQARGLDESLIWRALQEDN